MLVTGSSVLLEHRVLMDVIKQTNSKVICEIGVWQGDLSDYVLSSDYQIDEYVAIDPYKRYDPQDGFMAGKIQDAEKITGIKNLWELTYIFTRERLAKYTNCTLIREESLEVVNRFPDGCFDLVYLDGNHNYDYTKQDITAWLPKVRKGGVLCGHDYGAVLYKGVQKAVDELLPQRAIFEGKTWVVIKEK